MVSTSDLQNDAFTPHADLFRLNPGSSSDSDSNSIVGSALVRDGQSTAEIATPVPL